MTEILNFISPSRTGKVRARDFDSMMELHPTQLAARFPRGVVRGIDNSVWLLRKVPLQPYRDARALADQLAAVDTVMRAIEDLSTLATNTMNRRLMSKSSYRAIQLLLVNVPEFFTPDPSSPIATKQARDYGDKIVDRRLLTFAVQLKPAVMSRGIGAAAASVAETMRWGGTPMEDYERDIEIISALLSRAGMTEPTVDEIRLADSWWSDRQRSDSHFAVHPDHLHVFESATSAVMAKENEEVPCAQWPDGTGHNVVSIASVEDFENLNFTPSTKVFTQWVSEAITQGALAVSIRGLVEPAKISAEEMRRQHRRIQGDIEDMVKANKMTRHQQQEQMDLLRSISQAYETGGFPTLHDSSVLLAFNGMKDETRLMQYSTAKVRMMENRQLQGLTEMQLTSMVRANPNRHELPISVIACSGLISLNKVGDKKGAILGFDEGDNQPALCDSSAAFLGDSLPIMLIAGATGSGKTMVGLDLADQWQEAGVPVVFIDPKPHTEGEGHAPVVENMGGTVASLDDLLSADGVFDPIRFMPNPQAAVDQAVDLLMSINPWGRKKEDYEVALSAALQYGIMERGARCLGQALKMAYEEGKLEGAEEVFLKCEELKNSSTLFGAMYGRDPQGDALRVSDGITLIEVGGAHLPIPEAGSTATNLAQRAAMALVRMMVFGSAMALTGREGVVLLDEAWVFINAGRAEMERLGRLARSQRVLPVLMTQRVTDATNAKLQGYISRGIILHIFDEDEARAACELFKVEATRERLDRIMAADKIGDDSDLNGAEGLNPKSLKALTYEVPDPDFPGEWKRIVARGSVGYYHDLRGRFIPVEITLPEDFLVLASTNLTDIRRRERVLQARRAEKARRRRGSQLHAAAVASVEELFPGVERSQGSARASVQASADTADPAPAGNAPKVMEAEDIF
ncbi:ATP-binding protein [Brachybacterium paraconglomeratum]|uniref:ATP-binding protein n=1 Tax=Brachybacterium paraconglomeratum TaxID=173362 RepID=UPI0022B00695|nr:ATP-binding protein [Brachybacterium paraconglomeratum]MCZ4326744.1 ATP-binding protein [Brachybacterium paraconglomeratum]